MQEMTSGGAFTDMAAMMRPPEQIYVATVIHPRNGESILTAHRSLDGAKAQIEQYANSWEGQDRDNVKGTINQVPLGP
ncbi:Uncharacterised protein [Mycobacteroides abscessus subsp. abscessus]|nr:Uncharacterised protein [Mycobacteroides abscessus subsp. abscessus]SHW14579.1 Uncharacterised protein [Mycobacteroides abscessus subsp. abscessus]SHW42201.1 Uncharacterised protein [Mycobacteroides abscessus subsp. abscessus]SIB34803.1 Uncharacterised protein [Mycobacteroides abscessus subsp. abscessus]SIC03157.1 Uncharacterised protein [Mycobacteroides abscessus subsp. abscessus]